MAKKEEKPKKSKAVLFVVLGLVILGIASFGGAYIWMKSKENPEEKVIVQAYQELGEFMVNLDDDDRSRYLKIKLAIGYDKDKKGSEEFLTGNNVALRDSAIFYLKGKKAKDFRAENEKALKKGLKESLNSAIEEPLILDVYMNDIIVQ
ncbi:MAG: flagellar basal body-associated FliL family protein [Clostridium sp.]|uniref:flagellar basal body-associated FliL family protein n=1 Tax=Clostridium sp. TaxID=1506 RepID=UPI003F40A29F